MTLSQEIYKQVSTRRPSCLLEPDTEYSPDELVAFLLHPRGIEYALATGFPSMAFLEGHRDLLEELSVSLLSRGDEPLVIDQSGGARLFAGDGEAIIYVDGCEAGLTTLVFLHGVRARVIARHYAVVKVHADPSCEVEVYTDNALQL